MGRFHGKVAIVTGAASGIGRAIAERLHREGASVLAADLHACEEWPQDDRFAGSRTDVTCGVDCCSAVEAAVSRWGGLDILVNCAGIGRGALLSEMDDATWDAVMDVNLKGVFLACRAAVPALEARGGGVIINLASAAGLKSVKRFCAYGASKAGVIYLTQVLALEGAPHQIRVNALCPTWIETPMLEAFVQQSGRPERTRRILEAQIPLGRIGTVDDVASAALFLASDEAVFITGAALPVDGGSLCA